MNDADFEKKLLDTNLVLNTKVWKKKKESNDIMMIIN
jgi:hypothetical protein